jgi:hypothetical protein
MPACDASGWVEDTIPFVLCTTLLRLGKDMKGGCDGKTSLAERDMMDVYGISFIAVAEPFAVGRPLVTKAGSRLGLCKARGGCNPRFRSRNDSCTELRPGCFESLAISR